MATGGPYRTRPGNIFAANTTPPTQAKDRPQGQRDIGFVGEIGNLLGDWLHNMRTGMIQHPALAPIQIGAHNLSEGLNTAGELNAQFHQGVQEQIGNFRQAAFGDFDPFGNLNPQQGQQDTFSPEAAKVDVTQQAIADTQKILPQFEAIEALRTNVPLDGPSMLALEQLEQGLQEQANELQQQLMNAQENLANQNALFNAYQGTFEGGLIPGDDGTLDAALDAGADQQGVTPELMQALNTIIDSDLSGKAKQQRIDFIMDQASMQQQARQGIQDMTANLSDIEELQSMTDVEKLISQGFEPGFVTPSFNLDLMPDPATRTLSSVLTEMDGLFTQSDIVLTPEEEDLVGEFISGLSTTTDLEQPGIANQIDNMAKRFGLDPTALQKTIERGFTKADRRAKAWDTAVTKDKLIPGTEEMAIAIYQTAIDKGWDEEMAASVAESVQLHALIQAKSGGDASSTKGATQVGVAGLSAETLQELGYDPNTVKGDMQQGISSLLDYIQINFGGSPTEALSYFYTTGEWGN